MTIAILGLSLMCAFAAFLFAQKKEAIERDVASGRVKIQMGEDISGASYGIAACGVFAVVFAMMTFLGFMIGLYRLAVGI